MSVYEPSRVASEDPKWLQVTTSSAAEIVRSASYHLPDARKLALDQEIYHLLVVRVVFLNFGARRQRRDTLKISTLIGSVRNGAHRRRNDGKLRPPCQEEVKSKVFILYSNCYR